MSLSPAAARPRTRRQSRLAELPDAAHAPDVSNGAVLASPRRGEKQRDTADGAAAAAPDVDRLFLGARWRQFGRHAHCACPARAPRPLLRDTHAALSCLCRFPSPARPPRLADGNGQPRPLLRGWAHFGALLYGTAALATGRTPIALHRQAAHFATWTLLGYVGSTVFHMCPWATLHSYQLALCFDFVTIRCAWTSLTRGSAPLFAAA